MNRIIEVMAALCATTLGLVGVVSEARAVSYPDGYVQLASIPLGVGPGSWSAMAAQVQHFMLFMSLLLVALSAGAYLHAFYRSVWGLAMLWITAVSLTVAAAYATLVPPAFDYTNGSMSGAALDVVPTALPVFTVVLALISALAAITPLHPVLMPQWIVSLQRNVDRVLHLQSRA